MIFTSQLLYLTESVQDTLCVPQSSRHLRCNSKSASLILAHKKSNFAIVAVILIIVIELEECLDLQLSATYIYWL
jgi:hypothetical protein